MFVIKEYEIIEDETGMDKRGNLLNTYELDGLSLFVYDGCHKIYIIEDHNDIESVKQLWGADEIFYNIDELPKIWDDTCPLRFISNWKLDKTYVRQGCHAEFDIK